MGSLQTWVLACRPKTLSAAVTPVAVGSACAYARGGFRAGPAAAALGGALLLQIGTNLANDVLDFEKGADTAERLGPLRVVQAGLIPAARVRAAAVLSFGLATLAGVYLTWVAGPWVVAIGVASVAAGFLYTGGPYPLGYHGLGELFVFVFFGVVAVCGTAFVEAGAVPRLAWYASLPVGALAAAILVVNNLRDRETDARAGKATLAVRWGARAAVIEYRLLLALAYGVPAVLAIGGHAAALLPLATAPLALVLLRTVARARGAELNRVLAGTARLLLVHGLLFAAGLARSGG